MYGCMVIIAAGSVVVGCLIGFLVFNSRLRGELGLLSHKCNVAIVTTKPWEALSSRIPEIVRELKDVRDDQRREVDRSHRLIDEASKVAAEVKVQSIKKMRVSRQLMQAALCSLDSGLGSSGKAIDGRRFFKILKSTFGQYDWPSRIESYSLACGIDRVCTLMVYHKDDLEWEREDQEGLRPTSAMVFSTEKHFDDVFRLLGLEAFVHVFPVVRMTLRVDDFDAPVQPVLRINAVPPKEIVEKYFPAPMTTSTTSCSHGSMKIESPYD